MLAFALGISDVAVLVPQPALCLLDLPPLLLHLVGEGRDVRIIKAFLDSIDLRTGLVDLPGHPVEFHLQCRELRSAVLRLLRLAGNGRFNGLLLDRDRLETAGELRTEHPVTGNFLVDLVPQGPFQIDLFGEPFHACFEGRCLSLQLPKVRSYTNDLVVHGNTEPADCRFL